MGLGPRTRKTRVLLDIDLGSKWICWFGVCFSGVLEDQGMRKTSTTRKPQGLVLFCLTRASLQYSYF